MTTSDSIRLARKHHSTGDLVAAEKIYRQILEKDPNQAESLHLLGVLVGQRGRADEAMDLIRRSIALNSSDPEAHRNLGIMTAQRGRLAEAVELLGKAAQLNPGNAQTFHDLAKILGLQNKWDDALAAGSRAAELKPNSAEILGDIAAIHAKKSQFNEAIVVYLKALHLKPDFAAAYMGLGQAFKALEKLEESAAAYRDAARVMPEMLEAHASAAIALSELDRFDEALAYHARAVQINPNSAAASEAMGWIQLRKQNSTEAIRHFRRAVEIDPNRVSTWNYLGMALQYVGQFEEAAACFQRVLATNPEMTLIHQALVKTKRRASEAEIHPLMERLARKDLTLEQRSSAEFAVATALDDAERFDEAFPHFAEANKLVKQRRALVGEHYGPEEFRARVDQLIALFTPELFQSRRDWGDPSPLPVFVVGMPRSGTTLAQQIIGSHPDVYGAGELKDIPRIAKKLGESVNSVWSPESVKEIAAQHIQKLREMNATASRIVDKMPSNLQHLGLISVLFPNTRVIFCRRDPRDTCLSCYFQAFSAGNIFSYDLADCGHYHRESDRLVEHWLRVLPVSKLTVRYEEVVADLEGQSRRLVDFLGLPWNPACLEFYRAKSMVQTSSVWQVRQPIYQNSLARWRHYEKYLGPLFDALAGKPHPDSKP